VYWTLPVVVGVTDWLPLAISAPFQPPLAVQLLALLVDQVSVAD
jgi:hypothetical protein